jgi:hypothetical protein
MLISRNINTTTGSRFLLLFLSLRGRLEVMGGKLLIVNLVLMQSVNFNLGLDRITNIVLRFQVESYPWKVTIGVSTVLPRSPGWKISGGRLYRGV